MAAHFGTDHHEVAITETDALSFLTQLIHHQDEPLGDPVCVPLHFVCRLAREQGIKVVMAGEGADELFWGYPTYRRIMGQADIMRRLLALPRPLRLGLAAMMPAGLQPRRRESARRDREREAAPDAHAARLHAPPARPAP